MALITFPPAMLVSGFNLRLRTKQLVSSAPFGGSEEVVDLLNDRWVASLASPKREYFHGADIEAFINSMRGQINTVMLYHRVRPQPVGTIRGTLTLSAAAAQGANSVVVTGCVPSNGTFRSGDMLGVGGLLVEVASLCTAVAGVVTVPITNRMRSAKASGTSVVWDKPTAEFRLLSTTGVNYDGDAYDPVGFEFGEKI